MTASVTSSIRLSLLLVALLLLFAGVVSGQPPAEELQAEASETVAPAQATPSSSGCCCGSKGCMGGAAKGGMGCMGGDGQRRMGQGGGEQGKGGMGCMGGGGTACMGQGPRGGGSGAEGSTDRPGMGGMRGMGGGPHRELMHSAMSLVHQRMAIEREVEEIPGGVRTRTVVKGEHPDLADLLLEHVQGMAGLLEQGGRVRNWDPLFSELFDHADQITLAVEKIEGGVLVVETSEDPEVAKLIRAHAYKVNEFLARGHDAVHETTPLPEDYRNGGS